MATQRKEKHWNQWQQQSITNDATLTPFPTQPTAERVPTKLGKPTTATAAARRKLGLLWVSSIGKKAKKLRAQI